MQDQSLFVFGGERAGQPASPPVLTGDRSHYHVLKTQLDAARAELHQELADIETRYQAEHDEVDRRKAEEVREVTSLLADFGCREEATKPAPGKSRGMGAFFREKLKGIQRDCKSQGLAPASRDFKLRVGLERARILTSPEFAERFPVEAAQVQAGRIDLYPDIELAVRQFDLPLRELLARYEAGTLQFPDKDPQPADEGEEGDANANAW